MRFKTIKEANAFVKKIVAARNNKDAAKLKFSDFGTDSPGTIQWKWEAESTHPYLRGTVHYFFNKDHVASYVIERSADV